MVSLRPHTPSHQEEQHLSRVIDCAVARRPHVLLDAVRQGEESPSQKKGAHLPKTLTPLAVLFISPQ